MRGFSDRRQTVRWLRSGRVVVILLTGATVVAAGQAMAATSSQPASTQLSLHAAPDVLSVTVSPTSATFGSCTGGDSTSPSELGFPNGICHVSGLLITNTGLPGHMMVSGAAMSPAGGGAPWVLCGGSDGTPPVCSNGNQPGADQYNLALTNTVGHFGLALSGQAQCDTTFSGGMAPGCSAASGQKTTENVRLLGPQSTSSGANSYTTTITWTVTP